MTDKVRTEWSKDREYLLSSHMHAGAAGLELSCATLQDHKRGAGLEVSSQDITGAHMACLQGQHPDSVHLINTGGRPRPSPRFKISICPTPSSHTVTFVCLHLCFLDKWKLSNKFFFPNNNWFLKQKRYSLSWNLHLHGETTSYFISLYLFKYILGQSKTKWHKLTWSNNTQHTRYSFKSNQKIATSFQLSNVRYQIFSLHHTRK